MDADFDENFNIYAGGVVQRAAYNENIVLVKFDTNGNLIFQKNLFQVDKTSFTQFLTIKIRFILVGMLLVQIFLP
jgi:hypothetical protein